MALRRLIAAPVLALAALALMALVPARAAETGASANYWRVVMLKVEDGQVENYTDYLRSEWKAEQEWAKSKGYILDYHVFANTFRRPGEPDLFVAFEFKNWPDDAEAKKRQDALLAMLKQDRYQYDAGNAARRKMRSYMGMILLKELPIK